MGLERRGHYGKYNKERLARASEAVRKAGLSQIIVSDAAALWYLTEEEIHPGERLTVLVIPADSDPYWVRNRLFPLKSNGIADHPSRTARTASDFSPAFSQMAGQGSMAYGTRPFSST